MSIRSAAPSDAVRLELLIQDYLRESFPGHLGTQADVLQRDLLAGRTSQCVLLAESVRKVTGFIAWDAVYDFHWAARGAQVADLYVVPAQRGLGVALELLASVCAAVANQGGAFLRGGAYDRASTRAFYNRVAVVDPTGGDTHLSAKAFQHFATLGGRSAREIMRALPPREWNWTL